MTYSTNGVCKNCGWRGGQHRGGAAEGRCPDQESSKSHDSGYRWLETYFEASGVERARGDELANGKWLWPTNGDPSAQRDAQHVPQTTEPYAGPYEHFPDLKGWTFEKEQLEDAASGCEEIMERTVL